MFYLCGVDQGGRCYVIDTRDRKIEKYTALELYNIIMDGIDVLGFTVNKKALFNSAFQNKRVPNDSDVLKHIYAETLRFNGQWAVLEAISAKEQKVGNKLFVMVSYRTESGYGAGIWYYEDGRYNFVDSVFDSTYISTMQVRSVKGASKYAFTVDLDASSMTADKNRVYVMKRYHIGKDGSVDMIDNEKSKLRVDSTGNIFVKEK